jgi:O-antigen ligase
VHSDFIQVAANLGIIPAVIFGAAYLWTAFKLFKLVGRRSLEERPLYLALLLAFITAGGIVSTQVIIVLPQLACPVWLIWALAAVALRQHAAGKEKTVYVRSRQCIRVATRIQLPEHSREDVGVGSSRR